MRRSRRGKLPAEVDVPDIAPVAPRNVPAPSARIEHLSLPEYRTTTRMAGPTYQNLQRPPRGQIVPPLFIEDLPLSQGDEPLMSSQSCRRDEDSGPNLSHIGSGENVGAGLSQQPPSTTTPRKRKAPARSPPPISSPDVALPADDRHYFEAMRLSGGQPLWTSLQKRLGIGEFNTERIPSGQSSSPSEEPEALQRGSNDAVRKVLAAVSKDGPTMALQYNYGKRSQQSAVIPIGCASPELSIDPFASNNEPYRPKASLKLSNCIDLQQSNDAQVKVPGKSKLSKTKAGSKPKSIGASDSPLTSSMQMNRKGNRAESNNEDVTSASDHHFDSSLIPVEVIELIVMHLSSSDVKSMRLVDRAFEKIVSPSLFKSVVVPFNPHVYGRLGEPVSRVSPRKAQKQPLNKPVSIDLDIFPSFGSHIRQFGMSFDLDQYALANPPTKNLQEGLGSFWGSYQWPFRYYRRFQDRAELEIAADETQIMKHAFSHLKHTTHLGLALDCGLGWLNGPDLSIRARVLKQRCAIFGSAFTPNEQTLHQRALWEHIESGYRRMNSYEALKTAELIRNTGFTEYVMPDAGDQHKRYDVEPSFLGELGIEHGFETADKDKAKEHSTPRSDEELQDQRWLEYGMRPPGTIDDLQFQTDDDRATSLLRLAHAVVDRKPASAADDRIAEDGMLFTRPVSEARSASKVSPHVLIPGNLSPAQKEWLLETAWAQEAFLSSYMIAITDNAASFTNISKLTLARISSRHVSKLCRDDFWSALSTLKELDIKVVADHRDVQKTQAGYASISVVEPSQATASLHYLLNNYINRLEELDTISVGYADGGEHADGIFARNRLLLPAPLTNKMEVQSPDVIPLSLLKLPHVKQVELVNCWIAPNILEAFILAGKQQKLKTLVLNSVSLTAHPRFRGQHVQQFHQGVMNMQAMMAQHLAQLPALNVAAGVGNPIVGGQHAQAVAQALQNIQQQIANQGVNHNVQQALLGAAQQLQNGHNGPGQHGAIALVHALNFQGNAGVAVLAQPAIGQRAAREGSWGNVFGRIKAALTMSDKTDFEMKLISCGYARLHSPHFDQFVLDQAETHQSLTDPLPPAQATYYSVKKSQLQDKMIQASDLLLATIVTALPEGEMGDLQSGYGLQSGWPDVDLLDDTYKDDDGWGKWGCRTREAPEFDGCRTGGSGRFSGKITNWVALMEDEDD